MVQPGEGIFRGSVLLEDEAIRELNPASVPAGCPRVDGRDGLLTPGMIDTHTHGIGKWMYEKEVEDLVQGSRFAAQFGTTTVYPTLVPIPGPGLMGQLEKVSRSLDRVPGARMRGLHLEGPFMALAGAACPTMAADLGLLEEMMAACGGRLAIMSISPETTNIIPVIERLVERGVVPFITHTRASIGQAEAAIAAGARHCTHFYDVFPLPPETEPGVRPVGMVEAALADPRVTLDFICDGCHVHPLVVRMALAAKGYRGIVLISDSNIGAGLPPGLYDTPWGYPVRVKPGDGARVAGDGPKAGVLAGSALTLDVAVRNVLGWLSIPPEQVWSMATRNPARLMRLETAGRIAVGADADLVLWDQDLRVVRTWVAGACVYDAAQDGRPAAG